MITTRLTRAFGIGHPIVLAPMAMVADARLALAVSAAGGLGLLGGGYGDRAWLDTQLAAVPPRQVGCGFITWSLARQPDLLDVALAHGMTAVFLSFGDPNPFARRVHDAGVPLICQVCTLAQARQALDAGARVLVAQGGDTVRQTVFDIVRGFDWAAVYDARALRNEFTDRWHGNEDALRAALADARTSFTAARDAGDYSIGNVFVGESVGVVDAIEPPSTPDSVLPSNML